MQDFDNLPVNIFTKLPLVIFARANPSVFKNADYLYIYKTAQLLQRLFTIEILVGLGSLIITLIGVWAESDINLFFFVVLAAIGEFCRIFYFYFFVLLFNIYMFIYRLSGLNLTVLPAILLNFMLLGVASLFFSSLIHTHLATQQQIDEDRIIDRAIATTRADTSKTIAEMETLVAQDKDSADRHNTEVAEIRQSLNEDMQSFATLVADVSNDISNNELSGTEGAATFDAFWATGTANAANLEASLVALERTFEAQRVTDSARNTQIFSTQEAIATQINTGPIFSETITALEDQLTQVAVFSTDTTVVLPTPIPVASPTEVLLTSATLTLPPPPTTIPSATATPFVPTQTPDPVTLTASPTIAEGVTLTATDMLTTTHTPTLTDTPTATHTVTATDTPTFTVTPSVSPSPTITPTDLADVYCITIVRPGGDNDNIIPMIEGDIIMSLETSRIEVVTCPDANAIEIEWISFLITDQAGSTAWENVEGQPRFCAFDGDDVCEGFGQLNGGQGLPNGQYHLSVVTKFRGLEQTRYDDINFTVQINGGVARETPTATASPTETPTQTATSTSTETPTQTATLSATASPTETSTQTATSTSTETPTQTATASPTQTDIPAPTVTARPTENVQPTLTAGALGIVTPTPIPAETDEDDDNDDQ